MFSSFSQLEWLTATKDRLDNISDANLEHSSAAQSKNPCDLKAVIESTTTAHTTGRTCFASFMLLSRQRV